MSTDDFTSSQIERFRSLIAEYRDQRSRGDAPSVDEFASRHPELEERLKVELSSEEGPAPDATIVFDDSTAPEFSPSTPADHATQVFDSSKFDAGSGLQGSPVSRGSGSHGSSPPIEFREELGTGDVVGGYRLEKELGRGGMGVVFEAEHVDNGRHVAIKLLSADLNRTDQTVERFLKEASLAASLSHPRSTYVYEAGRDGEHFYTVMELMPGNTLNDLVKENGPLPITHAVDHILDAVDGLEAAHAAGIVHRDVKPSNCFLTEDSRVKIGDFGLSKSLVSDSSLTMTGMFLGTPQFAAPEQIRHQDIDGRTDVYALATSLYYLVAGKPPFVGGAAAVLAQIVADDPPPLKTVRRDAPKALGKVINRGMHKDPKKRFQTMGDFRAALLPFSSRSSFGTTGLRMAAFGVDFIILYLIAFVMTFAIGAVIYFQYEIELKTLLPFPPVSFTHLLLLIPYFTFFEGLWGRTFGKWLFGLRVLPDSGERPGFVRALIRSMLLPGLSLSMITIWRDVLVGDAFLSQVGELQMDYKQALGMMFATALQAGALGLVCITMRRANGYRGVHELLSSTYVSQPATVEKEIDLKHLPIALSVDSPDLPESIGGYQIVGQVGESDSYVVYEGIDSSLGRRVWVYTSDRPTALELAPGRSSYTRGSRPRWLQSGQGNGRHWFAVEAVNGVPFTHIDALPWEHGRKVVSATARELAAIESDDSLPNPGADVLWLDNDGGVKLIDLPWLPAGKDAGFESANPSSSLFASVVDKCCRGREANGGAHDMRMAVENGVIDYNDAAEAVERDWAIRSSDRLSLLMVCLACEFLPLFAFGGLVGAAVGRYLDSASLHLAQFVTLSISLIPVWIMAAYFKEGGPALRLCGMEIRSLSGGRASVLQRIVRATLVWIPLLVPITFLMTLEPWTVPEDFPNPGRLVWVTILAAWIGMLTAMFFSAGSLKSVRRNIQDLAAGTYLVRK